MNREEAKNLFAGYLKKEELRNTWQRLYILDAFLSSGGHFTADELHNVVKRKHPDIGFATVYRNLKLMCECGLANEIKVGNKKTRYEQKAGHEHHDHLICLKCGRFIEVVDKRIERLQDKLAEANDFIPQSHKLEIYGICKGCR